MIANHCHKIKSKLSKFQSEGARFNSEFSFCSFVITSTRKKKAILKLILRNVNKDRKKRSNESKANFGKNKKQLLSKRKLCGTEHTKSTDNQHQFDAITAKIPSERKNITPTKLTVQTNLCCCLCLLSHLLRFN